MTLDYRYQTVGMIVLRKTDQHYALLCHSQGLFYLCQIPKHPIKRKIFLPIFVERLFYIQMMMLLENNNVGFLAMKDAFFVNSYDYQRMQAFAGGALSVFAAGGFAKIKPASFYTGKNKALKFGEKFLRYGSQGSAFDFAYTSEKAFRDRSLRQHLGKPPANYIIAISPPCITPCTS